MAEGKRMAVLAGCNYPGWPLSELKGCINDVRLMKGVLISRFGFKEHNIELLTDEPNSKNKSTGANIKRALGRMVERAEDGDVLVFHFSGHGTLLRDKNHGAIIPTDYNIITDVDFSELIKRIHHKATFTILADACHSGGLIYQQKVQIGPCKVSRKPPQNNSCKNKYIPIEEIQNRFQQISGLNSNLDDFMRQFFGDDVSLSFQPFFLQGFNFRKNYDNGILLSGCQNDEKSYDNGGRKPPHGMFTDAVVMALTSSRKVSNRELVLKTREFLENYQHPCLYSSDENANASFLMQDEASTN